MSIVIRQATIRGKEGLWDVAIHHDRIEHVERNLPKQDGEETIQADGHLLSPGFVNPHIHLDKTLLGEIMRPNQSFSFQEALEITWEHKRTYELDEVVDRALRVVKMAVENGTTCLRAFADVDTIGGLKPVEALLELKKRCQHFIDIEVCAFPQEAIIRDPGTYNLLVQAMEMGADVIGGLPWFEMTDEDAKEHIDLVFEIAKKYDVDIHMLIDDTDDANSRSLEALAVKTLRENYQGRVSASHCGALAAYNQTYAAKVIDLVKAADIHIVSNPHISLVLAGRRDQEPVRRGITRVKQLLEAGVNVCSGQDDVNDPYYPFGRASQMEVALFMAHTAHLTFPHEIEKVFDMITINAARAMRLQDYGIEPGNKADLVLLPAKDAAGALRQQVPPLYVIKNGKIRATNQLVRKPNFETMEQAYNFTN
jgi:cytosine/creatinine deaminase